MLAGFSFTKPKIFKYLAWKTLSRCTKIFLVFKAPPVQHTYTLVSHSSALTHYITKLEKKERNIRHQGATGFETKLAMWT